MDTQTDGHTRRTNHGQMQWPHSCIQQGPLTGTAPCRWQGTPGPPAWEGRWALPRDGGAAQDMGGPSPHSPTGNGLMGRKSYKARSPSLGADSRFPPSPAPPPPHLSQCQASPPEHEELGAACCAPHTMLHCLASPLQPEGLCGSPQDQVLLAHSAGTGKTRPYAKGGLGDTCRAQHHVKDAALAASPAWGRSYTPS